MHAASSPRSQPRQTPSRRHAFEAAAACNSVCPVLGASLLEGRPVMLMPLYEISVHELTQEEHPNGMPPELAMRIASAAARALLPLHAKGLVHTNLVRCVALLVARLCYLLRLPI